MAVSINSAVLKATGVEEEVAVVVVEATALTSSGGQAAPRGAGGQ